MIDGPKPEAKAAICRAVRKRAARQNAAPSHPRIRPRAAHRPFWGVNYR
jgi:hypothetical protein